MPDKTIKVVKIKNLSDSVHLVDQYSRAQNDLFVQCSMDITFNHETYKGTRSMDDIPYNGVRITQEGEWPSERLVFGDLAKDFNFFHNNERVNSFDFRNKLRDYPIQRMVFDVRSPNVSCTHGHIRFYLGEDGSYLSAHSNLGAGNSSCKLRYHKKGKLLRWRVKDVGLVTVFNDPTKQVIFGNLIKRLYREFAVTKTGIDRRDYKTYVVQPEGEFNVSDLTMFSRLARNKALEIAERGLELILSSIDSFDIEVPVERSGDHDEIKIQRIQKKRIVLPDNKEIELAKSTYDFLVSEEGQRAVKCLRRFYDQAERDYDPLIERLTGRVPEARAK